MELILHRSAVDDGGDPSQEDRQMWGKIERRRQHYLDSREREFTHRSPSPPRRINTDIDKSGELRADGKKAGFRS